MRTPAGESTRQLRAGGCAALYLAAAYVAAMLYFLLVVDYPGATDPAQKVALIASNLDGMRAMYLMTYVVFGVVLAILALALHRRLRDGAPILAQVATVAGLLWAGALVASGLVFIAGMSAAAGLYGSDPAQAVSVWQAVEPVALGLGGAEGELLGGLWVLLVSLAALRTGILPRSLGWLGVAIGGAGLLSVAPPLRDLAYGFGLLQIVWLVWLGIILLRSEPRSTRAAARTSGAPGASLAAQRGAS